MTRSVAEICTSHSSKARIREKLGRNNGAKTKTYGIWPDVSAYVFARAAEELQEVPWESSSLEILWRVWVEHTKTDRYQFGVKSLLVYLGGRSVGVPGGNRAEILSRVQFVQRIIFRSLSLSGGEIGTQESTLHERACNEGKLSNHRVQRT